MVNVENLVYTFLSIIFNQLCTCQSQSQLVPSIISNFNQPCSQASQCNNNAGLYCIPSPASSQNRCGCLTNGTIFDEYQGRCVGKVGFPCIYQGNESFCPDKAHCSHQDPHHPDLYYYESRCFCDLNYFGDKQGRCVLAAKYGESCSASAKKCDEVSGLKCSQDGKCSCAFGKDQYYDSKKDQCVSYIFKNCTGFNSCPENARCEGSSINRAIVGDGDEKRRVLRQVPQSAPVIEGRSISGTSPLAQNFGRFNHRNNAFTNGQQNEVTQSGENNISIGKCVCDYGFTVTRNGKCLGGYRQSCSRLQSCNHEDNLECLDGSCNCKSPLYQTYSHTLKKCVNLVGAKCDSSRNSANSCVENSHCVNSFCTCKEGYSRTPERYCMLSYGKPCENGECNYFKGLACKSTFNSNAPNNITTINNNAIKSGKKCSCVDDSLLYDSQTQSCFSTVGSPCGKISQAGGYGKESFYVSCEPSAVCREEAGGDKSSRFCRLPHQDF